MQQVAARHVDLSTWSKYKQTYTKKTLIDTWKGKVYVDP